MYGEHPNGGMEDRDSHNVEFLEVEFPSIGEIKKDLELYELQQDLQPSLGEREHLNSLQVIEDGAPPLPERIWENLFAQGNEVHPLSPTPEENQPESEIRPQFPSTEHAVSPHLQDLIPQRDSRSHSLQVRAPAPLMKRRRNSSVRFENNKDPMIQMS